MPKSILMATIPLRRKTFCAFANLTRKEKARNEVAVPGRVLQVFVRGGGERTPADIMPHRSNPLCTLAHINRDILARSERSGIGSALRDQKANQYADGGGHPDNGPRAAMHVVIGLPGFFDHRL